MENLNKLFTKFYHFAPLFLARPKGFLADTCNGLTVGSSVGIIFSIIFFSFWLLFMGLFVIGFILWILMLIDCLKREFPHENDKVMWILVLVLANWLGAVIYYFMVKRQDRVKKVDKDNKVKKQESNR